MIETAAKPASLAAAANSDLVATLARRSQDGDAEATRQLFDLLVADVHRIVWRLLGPDPEHEDVCQSVLVAVHQALAGFRHQSQLSTWLYRICIRTAARHRRKAFRFRRLFAGPEAAAAEPATPDPSPEERVANRERAAAARAALFRMGARKRTVYQLVELEGLAPDQVAAIVDAPLATVHTRLFHARRELARALCRHDAREAGQHADA
ncbi:MAG: RNA polymerase sigma factor [Deltaproteobacteria bacterium]|nr:RNA polymerase sigma factor [Deltaproteobacteria bacterium]